MPIVLVNADDFGLHRDIDRGILDCVDAGVVQSISFSPQGQSLNWDTLHALAARDVRIGLHVTLVGEPWLTDGRLVPGWKDLVKHIALPTGSGRAWRDAVKREVRAQVEAAESHRIPLAHIDSHQHIHVFPGVWQPVFDAAKRHRIPRIRVPWAPSLRVIKRNVAGITLQALARRRKRAVPMSLSILGIAQAGHNSIATYTQEFLSIVPQDIELCVHPGINTPELEARYSAWRFDWTGERDALLDSEFRHLLARGGWTMPTVRPA